MIMLTKSNEEMAEVFSEVALFFETIASPINMDKIWIGCVEVIDGKHCGTPACVGGWLTYHFVNRPKAKHSKIKKGYGRGYWGTYWGVGADILARELGIKICVDDFSDGYALTKWAEENPEIWGNKFGKDMFFFPMAYSSKTCCFTGAHRKITAQDIAQHFAGVAERLRESSKDQIN